MSKLLCNVLKISGGCKCPKFPPLWLRACDAWCSSHKLKYSKTTPTADWQKG